MYKIDSSPVVLIVDDSPDTLGMLNDALENTGMMTLVALDGQQALNIAKKMQPDVILLDAIMPMMDGFETCRQLKSDAALRHTPVIFMTGLSDTDSVVRGFDAGGVDYLTKPINPTELIARMKVHLHHARQSFSAQFALDNTGQCIYAAGAAGDRLWATPGADQLIGGLPEPARLQWQQELTRWFSHHPQEGSRLHFAAAQGDIQALYLGKSSHNEHLVQVKSQSAQGDINQLNSRFELTPREAEVLLWLARGKTNREIAEILELSPRTINKHLEQVFKKMGVDNRTSAAAMALNALHGK